MIKNIVFDMGKVLVNYDSFRASRHFAADEREMEAVNTSVFVSPEWLMLDMGVITEEEALRRMQDRLPQGRAREAAALCLEHWHEYCMWPVEGMESLVIPGIRLFDGVLFSAEVKCIKPQREIYLHLFDRFRLKPEECFFIDDQLLNIEGAKACGMEGYCFADGDVEKLRQVLKGLA